MCYQRNGSTSCLGKMNSSSASISVASMRTCTWNKYTGYFSNCQALRFCLEISTLAVDTRDPVRHGRRMYVFLCACSKCGCVWVVAITQRRERNPPSVQKVVKSPAAPFFCLAKFLPTQRLWNSDLQNFMPGCLHFLKVFFFLEKLWQPSSSATSCTSRH